MTPWLIGLRSEDFYGLTIQTNNFSFEVKVDFGLNYTFPGWWVGCLMGGWLEKMKIEKSSASAWSKLAELGI